MNRWGISVEIKIKGIRIKRLEEIVLNYALAMLPRYRSHLPDLKVVNQ